MLTWSVITEKIKADERAEQLTQMVEGMPVGVMMCDTENFENNYMNKFSTDMPSTIWVSATPRAANSVASSSALGKSALSATSISESIFFRTSFSPSRTNMWSSAMIACMCTKSFGAKSSDPGTSPENRFATFSDLFPLGQPKIQLD